MVLEIETFSLQIRRVSAAFVSVLHNAYVVWCPFGLVRFPSINKNIKISNININDWHLRPLPRRPPPLLPPTIVPFAKHDPMKRWTSQFKMMDRLLALKKPIIEYFRQHPENARKLTSHEWTANEVCCLLDDVSKATIRMQGAGDTHVSQAMLIMSEVIAMLKEKSHTIRVSNATVLPPPPDGLPTESTQVAELTLEAQDVREALLEVMEDKGVGKASLKTECL